VHVPSKRGTEGDSHSHAGAAQGDRLDETRGRAGKDLKKKKKETVTLPEKKQDLEIRNKERNRVLIGTRKVTQIEE